MTELDPTQIIKDKDCIYFQGEKYQKVNNRPASLWNVMRHSRGYSVDCADEIVIAVEEWLVKQTDFSVNKVIERLWEQSE